MEPIRVTHVIHGLGPGGAEHLLVDLARVAPEADLQMSVVSLMPLGDHRYPAELERLGVEVRSLDLVSRWDPRGPWRATDAIDELAPDVIHAHLKHADLVGGHASHRLGIPMVSTLHVIEDAPGVIGRVKRQVAAWARLRQASATIAVSNALARWYRETFPQATNVVTVRNGVPEPPRVLPADAAALRKEWKIPTGNVVVSAVAILRAGKGHSDLIEAARRLADRPVSVVIVGDGPEAASLRQEAADLPSVVFAGFRDDVAAVMAAADVVVHPSHFDALPTSLIHAQAASRPTVATSVGGIPEIVVDGTGMLVQPHDAQGLAEAIEVLVADPDLRAEMGVAARRHYESEFSGSVWARRLANLYRSVLSERSVTSR